MKVLASNIGIGYGITTVGRVHYSWYTKLQFLEKYGTWFFSMCF